jgi:hypothetical protein
MKCVITGHTSGVGKALYHHFVSKGWDVIGMSRSNGYDIEVDQDKVIADAVGCDLFVNCAYAGTAQLKLLNALHDKVHSMIVVGSVAADWAKIWKGYGENKEALQNKCKEIALEDNPKFANIFYLKLAFCENASWPAFMDNKYKASFSEITKIVDMWLEVPKIFSVEFTLKKTSEIMDYARKMNPHD